MGRIWTQRDEGGGQRFPVRGNGLRENRYRKDGMCSGSQEIVSIGCEGKEIEVSAAKLDWGYII